MLLEPQLLALEMNQAPAQIRPGNTLGNVS